MNGNVENSSYCYIDNDDDNNRKQKGKGFYFFSSLFKSSTITSSDDSGRTSSEGIKSYNSNNATNGHNISSIISSTSNRDGRLFPGLTLYCEGHEKPILRGIFHLFFTLLLPFLYYNLFLEANGNFNGELVSGLYIFTNLWCYGFSSLYHVGRWSLKVEILLQKLDHCGIAIFGCGTFLPAAFLLLTLIPGMLLTIIASSTAAYACYHIMNSRPSILRLVLVASSVLPFLPLCYDLMNVIEFTCAMLGILFRILGMYFFIHKHPNLFPGVFGYHEIFHFFDTAASACVYILNWSIIRRTCNPFLEHQTVLVYVELLAYSQLNAIIGSGLISDIISIKRGGHTIATRLR